MLRVLLNKEGGFCVSRVPVFEVAGIKIIFACSFLELNQTSLIINMCILINYIANRHLLVLKYCFCFLLFLYVKHISYSLSLFE